MRNLDDSNTPVSPEKIAEHAELGRLEKRSCGRNRMRFSLVHSRLFKLGNTPLTQLSR